MWEEAVYNQHQTQRDLLESAQEGRANYHMMQLMDWNNSVKGPEAIVEVKEGGGRTEDCDHKVLDLADRTTWGNGDFGNMTHPSE